MDYKLVRLSNGEEIIGKITETENTITIEEGHALFAPEPGKIGFIPFMPYTKAKDGVVIDKKFVMFVVDPLDSLVDQVRAVNSGIQTPSKEIIT
jgi:hypothetical protein|tara:strand:+ start:127 stop:408 length:282 start_codon:yes stop_codon:yes gene_type:complete